MEDKELIKACAEFIYPDKHIDDLSDTYESGILVKFRSRAKLYYNPLTSGTQLNEIVEKMKLNVDFDHRCKVWRASSPFLDKGRYEIESDKSRTTAIIECIRSVLENSYD